MKIIHIADLHLGKTIYGVSMTRNGDQKNFINKFVEACRKEKADAVVISGDVYDRQEPSGDAVVLFDNLLTALSNIDITVMVISGNHDSGKKISYGNKLFEKNNVYLSGMLTKKLKKVTLKDEYGNVNFYLMPYIFPEMVANFFEDKNIKSYSDAAKKILEYQNIDKNERNILVCHQNVTYNGKESPRGGSESMVGGVGQIDQSVFDDFDYVALGHIHSGYSVGRPEVRYAGTPLCYHMDETKNPNKGYVLVNLGKKGERAEILSKTIEPLHKMRQIRGTKDEVYKNIDEIRNTGEYIGVVITDQRLTNEMRDYIKSVFMERNSIVMEIRSEYNEFSKISGDFDRKEMTLRSMKELFESFYSKKCGGVDMNEDEEKVTEYLTGLIEQENHEFLEDSSSTDIITRNIKKLF